MANLESWWQDLTSDLKATPEYRAEAISIDLAMQINSRLLSMGGNQRTLAAKMGVSEPYISQVLNGKPNMTLLTLCKIAHAVDAEVSISVSPKITASKLTASAFTTQVTSASAYEWASVTAPGTLRNLQALQSSTYYKGEDYDVAAGQ